MKKLLIIFTLTFLTASCSVMKSDYIVSENDSLSPGHGYLIGAATTDENTGTVYHRSISLKSADGGVTDTIRIGSAYGGLLPPGYEDLLFVLSLPAGDYALTNFSMQAGPAGGPQAEWYAKNDFNIPFKIEAGKSTYIGDIKNMPTSTDTWIPLVNGGYFVISDQSQRDLPALKKKYPFLDMSKVVVAVPKSGNVPPQFVQFK